MAGLALAMLAKAKLPLLSQRYSRDHLFMGIAIMLDC